jgi:2-polyprenyl-3-methyl-5-hydroxy-6-metoxy-1,4-benzoquinol methylase
MDEITKKHLEHHKNTFAQYGQTSKGVDWGEESEFWFRHARMLQVMQNAGEPGSTIPSLLDVGCGWGATLCYARELRQPIRYTGIDIVPEMIEHACRINPDGQFICANIFDWQTDERFDYVICNGIMTLKHASTSIIEMETFCRQLIKKMFDLCERGIAFSMMSSRVNFMADNLYYQNPSELLAWLLSEVSPRVILDHGYSSLGKEGKFYDFIAHVYK